jgi:outer membrane biosynthesis protein TonB
LVHFLIGILLLLYSFTLTQMAEETSTVAVSEARVVELGSIEVGEEAKVEVVKEAKVEAVEEAKVVTDSSVEQTNVVHPDTQNAEEKPEEQPATPLISQEPQSQEPSENGVDESKKDPSEEAKAEDCSTCGKRKAETETPESGDLAAPTKKSCCLV